MEDNIIKTINQTLLPNKFEIVSLRDFNEVANAIKTMIIRGAPAIGAMGAYGLAQSIIQLKEVNFEKIKEIKNVLQKTRPTAYDLTHGLNFVIDNIKYEKDIDEMKKTATRTVEEYANMSVEACRKIGKFGNKLIENDNKTVDEAYKLYNDSKNEIS